MINCEILCVTHTGERERTLVCERVGNISGVLETFGKTLTFKEKLTSLWFIACCQNKTSNFVLSIPHFIHWLHVFVFYRK